MSGLVEAGLTPLEAIEFATIRPAEFLALQDEMGTIAVGQGADLVLLARDPLENIANTRTIEAVVSRGRLLRPEDLNGRSLLGLEVGFEDMSTPEHLHLAVVSQLDGELLDA